MRICRGWFDPLFLGDSDCALELAVEDFKKDPITGVKEALEGSEYRALFFLGLDEGILYDSTPCSAVSYPQKLAQHLACISR